MSIVKRIDELVQSGMTQDEAIRIVAEEDGIDPKIMWAMNITFRKYDQAFKNLRDR